MDESARSVSEVMRQARQADQRADRLLWKVPPESRDAKWADAVGLLVRDARVSLRQAVRGETSAISLAETDQLEMRLRLHGWHAVQAGCLLLDGESLPGD